MDITPQTYNSSVRAEESRNRKIIVEGLLTATPAPDSRRDVPQISKGMAERAEHPIVFVHTIYTYMLKDHTCISNTYKHSCSYFTDKIWMHYPPPQNRQ